MERQTNLPLVAAILVAVGAAVLLPGISLREDASPVLGFVLTGMVFAIVNQLISFYPSDIRTSPPAMILILWAGGIVQDTLVWLLAEWVGGKLDGYEVDGFGTALLGGVIVRTVTLALLALKPSTT
ncbi:phage holin family protein [Streptomyces sp. NBC_00083]|uniref:phage holin family protein n=1 Tax=Streptomyces sp. NBC_00083 TaxID=2975647 RepID=UPI002259C85E|nr:phage holin family protein [Streptomyces sp. NBC_00083]MCX5385944.1 phage holin family protein [Streptomyces sp. NBC_00083]